MRIEKAFQNPCNSVRFRGEKILVLEHGAARKEKRGCGQMRASARSELDALCRQMWASEGSTRGLPPSAVRSGDLTAQPEVA